MSKWLTVWVVGTSFVVQAAWGIPSVKMDGSSTVYPISEAVAEDFQLQKKNTVTVTVGISGTGGGFKKFCRGDIDIANASRPITESEMAACRVTGVQYMELPIAFDALTVVVNPKNTFIQQLTIAELKSIWGPDAQGKVNTWKNVNPLWPDLPLKLYGAGADSGTFDYFTEAINGRAKSMRGDYTASEDDNVLVQGVSRDAGGLGFFGYAYYVENKSKLRAVPIVNTRGTPVSPNEKTVEDGSYNPLSRPVFIYVNAKSFDRPEVKEFIDFYLKQAPKLVKEAKYIPLPTKLYQIVAEHVAKRKLGSVFGGHSDMAVTMEALLKKEAKI